MPTRQLLITRSSQPENRYGLFAGEILKAEGFNGFVTVDLDTVPLPALQPDDLVVVTRCFLRYAEIEQLRAGIEGGARVVCLQPSVALAEQLGWRTQTRAVYPGWVRIREGYPGAGLPIQAHIPVAAYTPQPTMEYDVLADAVQPDWQDGGCPAAVRQRIGRGEVALFFYDLAEAVARIRFGNPDLTSLLTNGNWQFPHACELFEGHVDERVLHLPQADFHGQLLAHVLTDICAYPLARFWYYPEVQMRAAAVFQSDDDWSTPEQFAELADMLRRHQTLGTFYLVEDTHLPDETVAAMQAEGHTFAPHVVSVRTGEELYFAFPEALERQTAAFKARYGDQCSTSLQCHCAPWLGYLSWVPVHLRQGYRLLFVYMSIPMQRLNAYMCGSGRALRFCDETGTLFNSWQQPLLSYDDESITERVTNDPQSVVADFQRLLQGALNTHHTTLAVLSHPVSFATYSRPYIEACFDLLLQEGVPVYNGDQWCAFLDRRDAVRLTQSLSEDGRIACTVSGLSGSLPLMIPLANADEAPVTMVDGVPAHATVITRLEQQYLAVQLEGKADGADITVQVCSISSKKELV